MMCAEDRKRERAAVVPCAGMPATIYCGSDCYAATVVGVSKSGHRIELQRDKILKATKNSVYYDSSGGAQHYLYERNEKAPVEIATRRRDGEYRMKGCKSGNLVSLGTRRSHFDPCF